jgi:hypothetical protein
MKVLSWATGVIEDMTDLDTHQTKSNIYGPFGECENPTAKILFRNYLKPQNFTRKLLGIGSRVISNIQATQ